MRECPDRQIISQGIQNKVAQNRAGPVDGALDGLAAFYLDDKPRKGFLREVFCKRVVAHDGKGLNEEIPAACSVESRHIVESQLGRAILHCRGFVNQTETAQLLPAIRFHGQNPYRSSRFHIQSHTRERKEGLAIGVNFILIGVGKRIFAESCPLRDVHEGHGENLQKTAVAILSKDSDRGSFL